MSFLSDLIAGSSPRLETRSLSTISPEQRANLDALIAQLSEQPAATRAPGTAGLSPFEQRSLTALEERSRALAMPDPTLEAAGGAVRSLTDFEDQTGDASRFFQRAVQDPLLQSFQREILPQISRQFGGANFFSTERQAAEGLAREDLLESLAAQKATVELDQFNQARQRALQAAGLAPGLTQAENQRSQTAIDILRAAGIEREVEQEGMDRVQAEFVRQQQAQLAQNQLLAQLGLTPTIENIGMTDPGNAGLISTLLGALAAGAGQNLGAGIGRAGGNAIQDLLGRLFTGDGAGGGSADLAGLIASMQPGIAAGIGATGAANEAALADIPMPTLGTPAGTATIFEGADLSQLAAQVAGGGGGAGLGSLVAGLQPGIQTGVGATTAAGAAELAGMAAPTVGGGAGAALGGGAGADIAAGGAGAGSSALAIAAPIAAAGALIYGFANVFGNIGDSRQERILTKGYEALQNGIAGIQWIPGTTGEGLRRTGSTFTAGAPGTRHSLRLPNGRVVTHPQEIRALAMAAGEGNMTVLAMLMEAGQAAPQTARPVTPTRVPTPRVSPRGARQ